MSTTIWQKDAYDLGISVAVLKQVAPLSGGGGGGLQVDWAAVQNKPAYTLVAGDAAGGPLLAKASVPATGVYATTPAGAQSIVEYSALATAGALVLRAAAGQIAVPLVPAANEDATSKSYVDGRTPLGTEAIPGLLQVGSGLGLSSPGVVALAAPGSNALGGIYQPTAASGLDVTNGILTAPGFVHGTVGTTAQRPVLTAPMAGRSHFDTTLGKPVWWTGSAWHDAAGVAA